MQVEIILGSLRFHFDFTDIPLRIKLGFTEIKRKMPCQYTRERKGSVGQHGKERNHTELLYRTPLGNQTACPHARTNERIETKRFPNWARTHPQAPMESDVPFCGRACDMSIIPCHNRNQSTHCLLSNLQECMPNGPSEPTPTKFEMSIEARGQKST